MTRPITRLRIVLPPQVASTRAAPGTEVLADRLADALSIVGVQVRQQLAGAAADGAPRADVALWLPDQSGAQPAIDKRNAPARVHVAVVVDPAGLSPRLWSRADALLVLQPGSEQAPSSLRRQVLDAARRAGRATPVLAARLVATPLPPREEEQATHSVAGRRVVLLDLRGLLDDLERSVVQLALRSQDAALVVVAPAEERSQRRIRELCARHAVDAWMTVGADGFVGAIGAADLVVGRPAFDELALAALRRAAVCVVGGQLPPLLQSLRDAQLVDDVPSVLQLAAGIDRRLSDHGGLDARGLALAEALFGSERVLYDALAGVEPLPGGTEPLATWEPIGPHKEQTTRATVVVAPLDAGTKPEASTTDRIEDALLALKQKLAEGTGR